MESQFSINQYRMEGSRYVVAKAQLGFGIRRVESRFRPNNSMLLKISPNSDVPRSPFEAEWPTFKSEFVIHFPGKSRLQAHIYIKRL